MTIHLTCERCEDRQAVQAVLVGPCDETAFWCSGCIREHRSRRPDGWVRDLAKHTVEQALAERYAARHESLARYRARRIRSLVLALREVA